MRGKGCAAGLLALLRFRFRSSPEVLRGLFAEDGLAASNNSLAWFLATTSEPALRDGRRALAAAEIAVRQEPENASYVDTLAAAYAEAGQFASAVETQERAIDLLRRAGQIEAVEDFESRLALYRNGEPARY